MFDKSRQCAHIAFNISNIENWKSGANACFAGKCWKLQRTSLSYVERKRRWQKNVLCFQKWIIDSTGSFFWQLTNCWVENTFMIFPLVCNNQNSFSSLREKEEKKEKRTPCIIFWSVPLPLALPQTWQSNSILFGEFQLVSNSQMSRTEPVPPVARCQRDLNAEACQSNWDFSGRGCPHCT